MYAAARSVVKVPPIAGSQILEMNANMQTNITLSTTSYTMRMNASETSASELASMDADRSRPLGTSGTTRMPTSMNMLRPRRIYIENR